MKALIIAVVALFLLSKLNETASPQSTSNSPDLPTIPTNNPVSNPLANLKGGPIETLGGGSSHPGPALTAPYYANNGVPNTLAPNPLPNPTFEQTVPAIANRLQILARSPIVTQRWLA